MHQYLGKCSCACVTIQFDVSKEINQYRSRKCDCDYCMQRDIEYLSDPKGWITILSSSPLIYQKQGSEQATFLLCVNCQTVVGVSYFEKGVSIGCLNALLLDEFEYMRGNIAVSPKKLNNEEKLKRWHELWSKMSIKITV